MQQQVFGLGMLAPLSLDFDSRFSLSSLLRAARDSFRTAAMQEKDEDKRQRLAAVLGIDGQDAQSLQGLVEAGQFKLEQEAKEQESFF
jgi:hypothetical protein